MKSSKRFFYVPCCHKWIQLVQDDFSHNGRLDYFCYKHDARITSCLEWRRGLDRREFKDRMKKAKNNEQDR